jgi:hypothetical protein
LSPLPDNPDIELECSSPANIYVSARNQAAYERASVCVALRVCVCAGKKKNQNEHTHTHTHTQMKMNTHTHTHTHTRTHTHAHTHTMHVSTRPLSIPPSPLSQRAHVARLQKPSALGKAPLECPASNALPTVSCNSCNSLLQLQPLCTYTYSIRIQRGGVALRSRHLLTAYHQQRAGW